VGGSNFGGEFFMAFGLCEAFDAKDKIAAQCVRFCTEKSIGFLSPKAKFPEGNGAVPEAPHE
jgi:hypothetical protein